MAPQLVFKYLGFRDDGVVRADFLKNRLFRFTQPISLSDDKEARPEIVEGGYTSSDIEVARRSAEADGLIGLSDDDAAWLYLDPSPRLRFEPISFPGVFAHLRSEEERIAAIREHDISEATEALEAFYSEVNHQLGVFCLTETPTNPVMWKRYGGEYCGIAVGFDAFHSFFKESLYKVEYTGQVTLSINQGVLHMDGRRVTGRSPPPLDVPLLLRKRSSFSNEREWRMIRPLSERSNARKRPTPPDVCLFEIPSSAVSCIVFGPHASKALRDRVWAVVHADPRWTHLRLYEAIFTGSGTTSDASLGLRPYRP